MKKYSWIKNFEQKRWWKTLLRAKSVQILFEFHLPVRNQISLVQVFFLMTLPKTQKKRPRTLDPMHRTELLSVSWRLWHDCCPHNELQCESCSNYDSFRWLMGENWTWIFHNLHLLFKWEIILELHANFCHCPEFPITVIGKVSEGVWRRSRSS